MPLFNREYRLEIGRPLLAASEVFGTGSGLVSTQTARQIDSKKSLLITDHRITFYAKKTNSASLNEYELTIYNVSTDIEDYLSASRADEVFVQLDAGYTGNLNTVIFGSVQSIEAKFEGIERWIKLTISDGYSFIKEAYTNRTFKLARSGDSNTQSETPKRTYSTYQQVVDEIIEQDLRLPVGIVEPIPFPLPRTLSFSGPTYSVLRLIAEELGYQVSIQNFAVNFTKKRGTTLTQVKNITRDSSLVGSPTPLDNSSGVLSNNDNAAKVGVKFKILLDGSVIPDTIMRLDTNKYFGLYKVVKVSHEGDSRGQKWYSNCEASAIDVDLEATFGDFFDFEPVPLE